MKFEAIDLGLSVNWATCNVGAPCPEEEGYYLAWGEIFPKNSYYFDSYKWCDGSIKELTKYNPDKMFGLNGRTDNRTVLEKADDAAYIHWGAPWRMPTQAEVLELISNCDLKEKYVNGKLVIKVQSKKNGTFIYLPVADHRYKDDFWDNSYYWTSSLSREEGGNAYGFQVGHKYYKEDDLKCYSLARYFGSQIRPVRPKSYVTDTSGLQTNALSGSSIPTTTSNPIRMPYLKETLNDYWRTCRLACLTEKTGLAISLGQMIGTENDGKIKEKLKDALKETRLKGHRITSVTITDNGYWCFTYGINSYWAFAPSSITDKLKQYHDEGHTFRSVSLLENKEYVILTNKIYDASRSSDRTAIQEAIRLYGAAMKVCVTNRGICIICSNGVYYQNIPSNLEQKLKTLEYVPNYITFTDSGKYIICFEDGDYYCNL